MEEIAWFEKYVRGLDFEIPVRKKDDNADEGEKKFSTDGSR